MKVVANPCDDGQDCTVDTCNEDTDTCSHEAQGECAVCLATDCTPDCVNKECGDDGCGGNCGTCAEGQGCASTVGTCADADQLGTCAQPRPLEVLLGEEGQLISGDSSAGLHQVVPACNSTSTAVEDVYSFTIDQTTGIDARSFGYDTVLHLRKEDPATDASECLDDDPAATVGCSDDAAPPGDFGSRVATALEPGTYYLIVDGFDSTQFGPYTLFVKFLADGCVPQCDGKFCGGDDGCGGDCGTCDEGFICNDSLRCQADPCVPNCTNEDGSPRVCGADGCGGTCGSCADGELCVLANGQCQAFPTCDHLAPTCDPACGDNEYCGTDCTCKVAGDPAPDLIVNEQRLADEVMFDTVNVDSASCAVVEQCVGGLGERRIVRFSVEVVNQGQATLPVPPPAERPDLFEFSPCHGHFHFKGFATYQLLDAAGNVIVTGRKQAYCMEDTEQVVSGPGIGCDKVFTCDEQGIQAGWSDLYGNELDCQWLDITDVDPGRYTLRVSVNPDRAFEEMSFDNNTASVEIDIQ